MDINKTYPGDHLAKQNKTKQKYLDNQREMRGLTETPNIKFVLCYAVEFTYLLCLLLFVSTWQNVRSSGYRSLLRYYRRLEPLSLWLESIG